MTQVITLLNQKGGVGKTSSCFHLSATLAKTGKRVLLIDNDPQASLTQGFFGPDGMRAVPAWESVACLYNPDADPEPETLIRATGVDGVSIVPGSASLSDYNLPPKVDWGDSPHGLRHFLREVGRDFEVVLIDNPPNLHACSFASLYASDWLVITLQAEDFGSQGLSPVLEWVESIRAEANPRLKLAGFLLSIFDRRLSVHVTYEGMLREMYSDAVFASVVPRAKDFIEAVAHRRPVAVHKPKSAASKAIAVVAEELLQRVGLATVANAGRGVA